MKRHNIREFDPTAFADLDADMWVAYYNHQFFRLFTLLIRLNYLLLKPSRVLTARAAWHSAMAAIVFRKTKGHEDSRRVLAHLTQYYKLFSNHNVDKFDYHQAAELELEWWLVDRYPDRYEISRAVALAEGMAAIYNLPASKLATYGQKRAAAMELLGDYHHNPNAKVDWPKLRHLLQEAYDALYQTVQKPSAGRTHPFAKDMKKV